MNTELNKSVAIDFFTRFTASDIAGVLDTLTEDVTWLIPGKPESSPSAGLYDKQRLAGLFKVMLSRLKGGLTMTVKSAIAEGNKVALEVQSYGELTNGNIYRQEYHFLMEFREGRICAVREYLDTQHAYAVWFQPPRVSPSAPNSAPA
jgi:ketosteroid isomerase-like protein